MVGRVSPPCNFIKWILPRKDKHMSEILEVVEVALLAYIAIMVTRQKRG